MSLLETILQANGGQSVRQIAGKLGIAEAQVQSGIERLVPALARGLKRNTASADGLESLLGALQTGGHRRYFDDPRSPASEDTVAEGNGILGHIFGSKEVSRRVAAQASERSGLDSDLLKKMLPLVATLVMAAMSKTAQPAAAAPDGRAPGGLLGSLLDADDDGSITDDLFDLAKKLF